MPIKYLYYFAKDGSYEIPEHYKLNFITEQGGAVKGNLLR